MASISYLFKKVDGVAFFLLVWFFGSLLHSHSLYHYPLPRFLFPFSPFLLCLLSIYQIFFSALALMRQSHKTMKYTI